MKHFTHLHEVGAEGLKALAEKTLAFKKKPPKKPLLQGRSVAFCFMNPSLRTQVSFEAATAALGGHPVTLFLGTGTWKMEHREGVVMDGDRSEHLKEAVPVLGRYCAAIGLRSFPEGKSWAEDSQEPVLSAFLKYSTVPVINMESATGHPCQAVADLATIKEKLGNPKGRNFLLTWAPHIKALPMAVPNSTAEMAAMAGMNVTICSPEGYDLDSDVMKRVQAHCRASGAKLTLTDEPERAFRGQHVVYAKAWGSLENYGKAQSADTDFKARWMMTGKKLSQADRAFFMHCLPVRRNLVVADDVLDGPASAVIDQAENRLHAAKAVLASLIGETK